MRQDQEPLGFHALNHGIGHLLRRHRRRRQESSRPVSESSSIAVRTPWGQIADTRMPWSPYVIASHSAKASAACLVTAYGADPICVSRPAAETVSSRYPSPSGEHAGQRSPRGVDVRHDIDAKHPVPLPVGRFGAPPHQDARVRAEYVHLAVVANRGFDDAGDVGFPRHVGLDCERPDFGRGLPDAFAIHVGHRHQCLFSLKSDREGPSDSGRRSRDHSDPAFQPHSNRTIRFSKEISNHRYGNRGRKSEVFLDTALNHC